MKTEKVELSKNSMKLNERILSIRTMSNDEFINKHGSGTLRDNKELGFVHSIQCLSERLAYTFGYGFEAFKPDKVLFNKSISECDESAYTIAGRWFKAYNAKKIFEEDHFEIKYVAIKDSQGSIEWEGIGIIVRETSANFIPNNIFVIAKVVVYKNGQWQKPVNFA